MPLPYHEQVKVLLAVLTHLCCSQRHQRLDKQGKGCSPRWRLAQPQEHPPGQVQPHQLQPAHAHRQRGPCAVRTQRNMPHRLHVGRARSTARSTVRTHQTALQVALAGRWGLLVSGSRMGRQPLLHNRQRPK